MFGKPDPNATFALADALSSWPDLRLLILNGNYIGNQYIGYQDQKSATYFLEKLVDFANSGGGNFTADLLNAIEPDSIKWTDEAGNFASLVRKPIREKCETEICTGNFNSTQTSSTQGDSRQAKEQQMALIKYQIQDASQEISVPSSASRLTPFLPELIRRYAASWFSAQAWKDSFKQAFDSVADSQGLDYVAQAIGNHCKRVVEECPSYFPRNAYVAKRSSYNTLYRTSTPALPVQPALLPN